MAPVELTPRRYETPTATLTVTARSLAISQWSDRPVVQPLRFQLAVTPADRDRPLEITGKPADLIALQTVLQDYRQGAFAQRAQPVMASGIALQPEGITQHRLTLGPLSSSPATDSLRLSTLELADWVDLFEQVEGQVRPLPGPLNPATRSRAWRQWGSLAAVFLVSVGTVAVWPHLNRNPTLPTASQAPVEDAELESSASTGSLGDRSVAAPETAAENLQPEVATAPAEPSPARPTPQARPKTASPERSQQTELPPESPSQGPATTRAEAPEAATSPTTPHQTAAREPSSGPGQSPPDRPERIADAGDGLTAESAPGATSPAFADSASLPNEWQPPDGFSGVLTYRITLTTDGIISAIAPQDEQSTESQSFTGLPEIGSRIEVDLGEELLIKFYDNGTVEVTPTPESP